MRVGSRRRDDRSRTQCESPPIQPASAVRTTASPRTRTPRSALRELPVGRRAALSARRSITAAPSSLRSRPTRGWSMSHLVRCDSESALARRPQPRSLSVGRLTRRAVPTDSATVGKSVRWSIRANGQGLCSRSLVRRVSWAMYGSCTVTGTPWDMEGDPGERSRLV
jgi:hypothetical protein